MKKISNNDERPRLPPGQHLTERFPILQKGMIPHVDRDNYKLQIVGEVENPKEFTLEDLKKIQDKEIIADIHCVTSWSKFDTKWGGKVIKGSTTAANIEAVKAENAILALTYEGEPINDKHGGPVRPIIPDLYFYKSAKWVIKITFLKEDRLGYWERGGYSNKADPWKEQRYTRDD